MEKRTIFILPEKIKSMPCKDLLNESHIPCIQIESLRHRRYFTAWHTNTLKSFNGEYIPVVHEYIKMDFIGRLNDVRVD